MKKSLIIILGLTLVLSGCEEARTNTPSTSEISGSQYNVDVNTSSMFTTKPVLPKPGIDNGEWDVLKLPSNVGLINPVPNNTKWQPMNFGEDKPLIAGSSKGTLYMATDAGVWYREGERWTFMPGTEKFSPIVAITVTPAGAPIIATGNQIFAYKSQKWTRISDNQEPGIQSLDWTKDGQLVAKITYYPQQSTSSSTSQGPAPMPIHGMMIFKGTKWYKPKSQSVTHDLIDTSRQDTGLGAPAMGVHYIGLSPTGTPTIEFMVNDSNRSIWQYSNDKWSAVDMFGFPVDTPDPDAYVETKDVTWWNGHLVVSSPKSGAMEWNGDTWNSVGNNRGMTSNYHRLGSVISPTGNTLFAEVKETVPPPPTTPRQSFNTLWEFEQNQWYQIKFPTPSLGSLFGDPVISITGVVAVSDTDGHDVWLYQNQKWQQLANGTGIFTNAHVGEMKFLPNGKLTIALNSPTANNIYEWTGSKWIPLLSDNTEINKGNFWFNYTWAPDGSIIIGLMNETGYSVWRYKNGKWFDLGLHAQRPEFLYVTKQNTLFVVTDKYVCWRMNLS